MDDAKFKQVITDTALRFFNDMMELKPSDDDMRDAHATLMLVCLGTIGDNMGATEAVRVTCNVLRQYAKDKPGLNLFIEEFQVPKREQMQ